jgi:hypothetical protein
MRTTIDIDDPILRELKALARREGKSLGRTLSDLLADVLGRRRNDATPAVRFHWIARPLGSRVDYADGGALRDAMDQRTAYAVRDKRRR